MMRLLIRYASFRHIAPKVIISNVVNSGVTGPNLTKLLYDKRIIAFNFLKLELQSSNPFWNASTKNKGEVEKFGKF